MAGFPPASAGLADVLKESPKPDRHVDYRNLPRPLPYEEIHREAFMSLKPDVFEGAKIDFTKAVSPKFFLSHSATMGPTEIPTQNPEPVKVSTANYEFGANYLDPQLMLIGRISHEGTLTGRLKWDLSDDLTLKSNGQISSDPHSTHVVSSIDYKGNDYRAQLNFGTGALSGASYIQSVTPNLSLGGEIFYAGQHRKSGAGYAARYNTDKMVATGQVATTGMVALSYVQKASEKVSFATEFVYNYLSRDVSATVGYDAIFRMARIRGKIDTNGCVTAFLEERLSPGLGFTLSAVLDHWRKDYKFGFGMSVGE